jgi:hypothetical protein
MAEEKAKVSSGVQASKAKAPVVAIADPPAQQPVKGKVSEKATRGTLDKR